MWRAVGDFIDSRTTWAAAEIEIRSRSSLSALTRIGFQKRSIAFSVCAVLVTPFEKRMAGIALLGQGECGKWRAKLPACL